MYCVEHKLLYLLPDEGPQIRTEPDSRGLGPHAQTLHVLGDHARLNPADEGYCPVPRRFTRDPVTVQVYNWRDPDGDVASTLQRLANAMGASDLLEALSATLHRHGQDHLIEEARARMQYNYRERHDNLRRGKDPYELWSRVRTEDETDDN